VNCELGTSCKLAPAGGGQTINGKIINAGVNKEPK